MTEGAIEASKTTVLIVDDDEGTRHAWCRFLVHIGLDVMEAVDGNDALRVAEARRPDIVIMDLAMPIVDGFEARRRLHANPQTASVPVVAVTGAGYGVEATTEAGFAGYLLKPVEPEALLREISRVLRRSFL